VAYEWVDCDRTFIAKRYDRLAGLIPFIDWLLFVPPRLRKNAVTRLELREGERVLEVGCGTGRNFPHLRKAVGPSGRVYGVDLSPGMLRKALELCHYQEWTNVDLVECDAVDYVVREPLDGVLFSFSYNTMPHHLAVLQHMWNQLRPGGRLVLMDSRLPSGRFGELILPFSVWLMRRTMLGNPHIKPWEHLQQLPGEFEMKELLFDAYYICRVVKPAA
jgi:demethylmenaquinone methyltransferase/2-methoxy-6-polyprenyl-1,4-benzoquinol methylase